MTVAELLGRISSRELTEWMAYSRLEPFGEERQDVRSAIIACTIANCNRGKNQPPYKLADFMPKFKRLIPMDDDEIKDELSKLIG
jgi:hypothetical protein